jgi:hypothetical protein
VAQSINWSLLGFEPQTKKSSLWFWGQNHQTEVVSFDVKTEKPSTTLVLRLNQETGLGFEVNLGETVATRFEAKLEKTVTTGFEAKPLETVAAGFEAKS